MPDLVIWETTIGDISASQKVFGIKKGGEKLDSDSKYTTKSVME